GTGNDAPAPASTARPQALRQSLPRRAEACWLFDRRRLLDRRTYSPRTPARRRHYPPPSPGRAPLHRFARHGQRNRNRAAGLQVRAHTLPRSHRQDLHLPQPPAHLPPRRRNSARPLLRTPRRTQANRGCIDRTALASTFSCGDGALPRPSGAQPRFHTTAMRSLLLPKKLPQPQPHLHCIHPRIRHGQRAIRNMHVPDLRRPRMLPKKIQPERRARREVYLRSSRRHFLRSKERPSTQLEVGSNVSARGENPFPPHRIHSCSVHSVCRLEYNKRWHRLQRKLESSVEKSRPVRSRQDPPIANSRVPHARILGPTGNRAPPATPNLELMTALLRAILRNRKRNCQKHCQEESRKECRKKGARTPNGSCHKYDQSRNRTIRENARYGKRTTREPSFRKQIPPLQPQPAIHRQHLPGNKLRSRGQEHHCRGNVRCRSISSHRRLFRHLPHERRRRFLPQLNHPRSHRIYRDLRRQRQRHHFGQHVYRRLRRAIVGMRRPRPHPAQRTHIDDAPSALSQIRRRLARHQKRSARVGSKNRIPLRDRYLLKLDGLVIRGVIHQ